VIVGNPCVRYPCLPGLVSAVESNDTLYILTKNSVWFWDGEFSWNDYFPSLGDSVYSTGYITKRMDIYGEVYFTIEVSDFARYVTTKVENNYSEFINNKNLLMQNYPNPFNPSTIIEYSIPKRSFVTLKVFDILGREIISLVNEEKPSGKYRFEFNAHNLSSGLYFYQLRADDFADTKKLILLR
jgi:hypothetical protein